MNMLEFLGVVAPFHIRTDIPGNDIALCEETGNVYARYLERPTPQTPLGWIISVSSMTYGKGRLVLGDKLNIESSYCYETLSAALAEAQRWNGEGDPEGWFRHLQSGRRRTDGDPNKEYIYD